MITNKLNDSQRLSSIRYTDMDTLIERQSAMENTMQNYFNRTGNKEYVEGSYISTNGSYYFLNIVISQTK